MGKEKNNLIDNIIGRSRDVLNKEKAEDIRLEANEALCERETVLGAIFDAATDAIFVLGGNGRLMDANPAACSIFGYSLNEIRARDISALFFPEDMRKMSAFDVKASVAASSIPEIRMRRKDGQEIWAEIVVKKLNAGCCNAVLAVVRDITEKRLSALAMREERDRARKYFDLAGVILLVINSSGEVSMINRKGCELLEGAEEGIVGKDWFSTFIPEGDRERFLQVFRDLMDGRAGAIEYHEGQVFTSTGKLRLIAWHETVLKDEQGRAYAILSSGTDITELSEAQEELLQARSDLEKKVEDRTRELIAANKTLEEQTRKVKRAEEIIRTIVEGTAALSGDEYFRSLVKCLASALKFKYALVGEIIDPEREKIRTLALWAGDRLVDNIEYGLSGTPCENVVGKELCAYPDKVKDLFPRDHLLSEMGVESYIGAPLSDSSGRPIGILVALDDRPMENLEEANSILSIFGARAALELQRKRTEAELTKSMEMLQAIIDNSGAAIFLKDEDGRLLLVNKWFEESLGLSKDRIIGRTDFDIFPEEIARKFREHDRQVIESGRAMRFDEVAKILDGKLRTFVTLKFPIPSIPGVVCGIATDITERSRIEQELKKSEERLKEAQEIARIGNWEWDVHSGVVYWSDEMYRIFGVNPGEFTPGFEKFMNFVHPGDRASVAAVVEDSYKSGHPYAFDFRIVLPDGAIKFLHSRGKVIMENGAKKRMVGTSQDVTEARMAEAHLRESEEKFRGLIETIPLGISITTEEGEFLEANTAVWKIFGYSSKQEFMSKKVQDLYCVPSERARTTELIKQGKATELEVRVKRKDGTEFFGALTAIEQKLENGKSRFMGFFHDITERKKMEAELLKAQKLESIGVLAGGIAHDFNNLLLGILGYVSIAKEQVEKKQKVYDILLQIEKYAEKTKGLARQLLTFSKGGEPVRGAVRVEDIIRASSELILRGKDLKSVLDFEDGLMDVDADEGQISQAMNNIIMNAEQAVEPGKGEIRITARNIRVTTADNLPLSEGDYVLVSVEDNGHGIPEKYIGKIFDPFFTTRKKASGLGLSVTYSIIKKHKGHIAFESEEGRGTVVRVYLPAVQTQAVNKFSPEKTSPGAGRVLVMDDEELVRDVAGEMLEILGYEAGFARKGEEAIEAYKDALARKRPYDAVILDLTVPDGMGGVDTLKRLLQIDPGVKAIVSSGYSKDPVMSSFRKYGFAGVIAKPYRVSEFGAAVKAVVEKKKS